MADNSMDKRTITVDLLGNDFLNSDKTGDKVAVHEDGTVVVTPA